MLQKLLSDAFVEHDNALFQVSPENITLLHHWHFGLTKDYYRSKDKSVLLADSDGKIRRITDIAGLLDGMMIAYNEAMEEKYREQRG